MNKKSKKLASILLLGALSTSLLAGCSDNKDQQNQQQSDQKQGEEQKQLEKLTVGASPAPHKEILDACTDLLAEKGYELVVVEFSDYIQPNKSLDSGDLDANFFQHKPYLDNFNAENNTELVSAGAVHYEPMGIFGGKTTSLEEIPDGATVAIPNDNTNGGRALLLLQDAGLITLDPEAGFTATALDIVDNPKNLQFTDQDAAYLPRVLSEVDLAVINGNYAIQAGVSLDQALKTEDSQSEAAQTYANIIAVRKDDVDSDKTKALVEVLQSDTIKKFITDNYAGAVLPM